MKPFIAFDVVSILLVTNCFVVMPSSCAARLSPTGGESTGRPWPLPAAPNPAPHLLYSRNATSSGHTLFSRRLRRSYNFTAYPSAKYWYQSLPIDEKGASLLVDEHNKYRRMVRASNMMMMKWSTYLALNAQKHADRCLFQHSTDRYNSGENIWAAPFANFSGAVNLWFNEIFDRHCGCTNRYKACCGHYTQVVWAETHKVGCGFTKCSKIRNAPGHRFILVCHYFPSGNVIYKKSDRLISLPAFQLNREGPCTDCPDKHRICVTGLCNGANS